MKASYPGLGAASSDQGLPTWVLGALALGGIFVATIYAERWLSKRGG